MKRSFFHLLSLVLLTATVVAAQQRKAAEPAPTVEAGVAQVEEGDFEAAVKTLERAIQALPDDAAHSRDRAKAFLYMAISYLGMSEEANARARFADALKQDKELALNPRQFSPRVLALFEQAKREMSGGPASTRPARGDSPHAGVFLIAVKGGDFAAVSQMLKEDPSLVAVKDQQYGATPLHWAALKGQDVIVGLLLAQGADPGAVNGAGETPLKVAQRQRREGAARLLRQHEDRIFSAIKTGDVATVREMLDADPSLLNRRDAVFGATPLHWAALKGQEAVVGLLLARGADATLTNTSGETALQVATRARKDGIASLLQPLAGGGAGSAPKTGAGGSAPATQDKPPVAQGKPPVAQDKQADLFVAAKGGDVARVRALLEKNPSWLNATDPEYGATALHWATVRGQAVVISFLMSAGADVNARNKAGETPLQVAKRAGHKDVIDALTGLTEGGGGTQ